MWELSNFHLINSTQTHNLHWWNVFFFSLSLKKLDGYFKFTLHTDVMGIGSIARIFFFSSHALILR